MLLLIIVSVLVSLRTLPIIMVVAPYYRYDYGNARTKGATLLIMVRVLVSLITLHVVRNVEPYHG